MKPLRTALLCAAALGRRSSSSPTSSLYGAVGFIHQPATLSKTASDGLRGGPLVAASTTRLYMKSSISSSSGVGPIHEAIESKLSSSLSPSYLDVMNESHMHSGPATESHFKVVVVSEAFEGKSLIARHRMVNEILKDELAGDVHGKSLDMKQFSSSFLSSLI